MSPRKKILIVDDDRDLLRGLTVRLRSAGYDVVYAVDGISAVSVAQQHLPDLVLLDLGLAGGDGFMVLDRFRSTTSLSVIPIIVLTATEASTNRHRALQSGAVDFLQKPVDNHLLLKRLRITLGEDSDAQEEAEGATDKGAGERRRRILVVDDDADLLRALSIRLRASGYDIVIAADAIAAVSRARKDNPDLIILDIGMPGGDGFQVMDRLRLVLARDRVPIIVVSARDPSINRERALKSGACAYFQKPVDNMRLLQEIRRVLESPGEGSRGTVAPP